MSARVGSPAELMTALEETIVGQTATVRGIVTALIAGGHALVEGPPGVAKTLMCRTLATAIGGTFKRIQFTPDMLPGDIVGTRIYNQRSGEFSTSLGPVVANVVLADEINRAPAKVQSALLEAMQERQVTIAHESHPLPDPFIVLATMNPLDLDGTYPLPQAQLDRFLVKLVVAYPSAAEELAIVARFGGDARAPSPPVVDLETLRAWQHRARCIHLERNVASYAVALVHETRRPHAHIAYGASPRATLALVAVARAAAFVAGRAYVVPDDVREAAPAVLRHRVALGFRAVADDVDGERLLADAIANVAPP